MVLRRVIAFAAVVVALAGCGAQGSGVAELRPATTAGPATISSSSTTEATSSTAAAPGSPATGPRSRSLGELASLRIDDRPSPPVRYSRNDWPTWEDINGDGCDAREQALLAASSPPAVTSTGCRVVSGRWVSPYDGVTVSDPSKLDIDHIVPLEQAHVSGGWRWTPGERRQFANDQANLVPVTASTNRSKGDRTPDEWRPPNQAVWCWYAQRYVDVKATYTLTVTTRERDALGQMLDTCPNP